MKQTIYLLILLLFGCNTSSISEQNQKISLDTIKAEEPTLELVEEEVRGQQKPCLEGIYEYDYPYDTEDMNENQYIAFKKEGDSVKGWYFGTSDEFDQAREGYLPGYFIAEIENLTIKGDSIFFSVTTSYNKCYATRPPIGVVDPTLLSKSYGGWINSDIVKTVNYSGKFDEFNLFINMFGEMRTYSKTRNLFHPGIDNYDLSKCRTGPLLTIQQNMDSLTSQMVLEFLSTFSVTCEANVEFGEWSNELLFEILSSNPELTVNVLSSHMGQIDTTSIYKELEAPLHDLTSIDSLISRIEQLSIQEQVRKSILGRIENLK